MSSNTATPRTKILLLGAGELGTAFLTHLTPLPSTNLTLGIRTPEKYTHLTTSHPNLSLTKIDLSDSSPKLSSTFAEYDILISATGFGADPSTVSKLANEVLQAGKIKKSKSEGKEGGGKLWYFPWQWGVDYDITRDGQGLMPLFGAQKEVRDLLRSQAEESNVRWMVVSTGIFMSFLFEPFWGMVDRSHEEGEGKVVVRCLRDWAHKVTVTDVQDIGRVLAKIIDSPETFTDNVLYIAGDTVSYGELAQIVERVSGKVVEKEEWGMGYLENELNADPENGIKKYRLVFAREGVSWDKKKTVNKELGMEMLDVETYAKELFNKKAGGE